MPSKLEEKFSLIWRSIRGQKLVPEFRFHPTRKWRADFVHIESNVMVEITGGLFVFGRHNRGVGFIKDAEKYNEAAFLGWTKIDLPDKFITIEYLKRIKDFINSRL